MSAEAITRMLSSLRRLDRAIGTVISSLPGRKDPNQMLTKRLSSYREIVRRQRILVDELIAATRRKEFQEVARLSNLVHQSSLMIKVDVGFVMSELKKLSSGTQASS